MREGDVNLIGDNGKAALALTHLGTEPDNSACSVKMLGSDLYLHQDAAVLERSLADGMAPFPSFDFGLLNRIHLNELVEMTLVAPTAAVVVESDRPGRRVDDGWVLPVGKLEEKPRRRAAEKFCRAVFGFGESQPATSRHDSGSVMNLRLNLHYVRHGVDVSFLVIRHRRSQGEAEVPRTPPCDHARKTTTGGAL